MVDNFFNVETDVDMLVSLVQQKGSISTEQAAAQLKVPMQTLQRWIDFLVEEEILGIEYKFVTPYLYFNKPLQKNSYSNETPLIEKKDFYAEYKHKGKSETEIKAMWLSYLKKHLIEFRNNFVERAKSKGITSDKASELWDKYYIYLKGDQV